MQKLTIHNTPLSGLLIADTLIHHDARGQFARLFCETELHDILQGRKIVQINQSITKAIGAVRGLHFQREPNAEMKLIRCLHGKVWDVAVDLRASSPTFGQWHAELLSAENGRLFMIPEGFAHGFQVLSEDSQLLYLHTASWTPAAEGGVAHNDPTLNIQWPLPVIDLSARDLALPCLDAQFHAL